MAQGKESREFEIYEQQSHNDKSPISLLSIKYKFSSTASQIVSRSEDLGRTVGSIMTKDFVIVRASDSLTKVMNAMNLKNVPKAIVVTDGKPIGVIGIGELAKLQRRRVKLKGPAMVTLGALQARRSTLLMRTARSIMKPVMVVSSSIHPLQAQQIMREHKVNILSVIQKGNVAGILTMRDVLKALRTKTHNKIMATLEKYNRILEQNKPLSTKEIEDLLSLQDSLEPGLKEKSYEIFEKHFRMKYNYPKGTLSDLMNHILESDYLSGEKRDDPEVKIFYRLTEKIVGPLKREDLDFNLSSLFAQ